MMGDVLNIARWEWRKQSARWMPWILLFILLLWSQVIIWGSFFAYRNLRGSGGQVSYGVVAPAGQTPLVACNDLAAGKLPTALKNADPSVIQLLRNECAQARARQQQRLQSRYQDFTLPGSLISGYGGSLTIGLILLTIFTASAIGAEYGQGTLRPILSLGVGRARYLAGKLLMILVAGAAALVALGLVQAVTSVIAKALESPPAGGAGVVTWGEAALAIGRTSFSWVPYVTLTALFTVVTRSSASGMAAGLGYYFAEGIATALLSTLFDWFSSVQRYLLARTIADWASSRSLGINNTGRPGDPHALLVLSVYLLISVAAVFWVFGRRDVTGASGS